LVFPSQTLSLPQTPLFTGDRIGLQSTGGKVHIRRTIVATTIIITTLLGTTACNLTSPISSLDYYAPSDGNQVDLGPLKARNVMYLVIDDNHSALVGSFANSSSEEITFALKFKTKAGADSYRQFTVAGYKVKSFGFENQPLLKTNLKVETTVPADELAATPSLIGGSSVSILIYTNTDQAELNVPVITQSSNITTYDALFTRLAKN
jgi:hypothetical protein